MTKTKLIRLINIEFKHAATWHGQAPPLECEAARKLTESIRRLVTAFLKDQPQVLHEQYWPLLDKIEKAEQEWYDVDEELHQAYADGQDVFEITKRTKPKDKESKRA